METFVSSVVEHGENRNMALTASTAVEDREGFTLKAPKSVDDLGRIKDLDSNSKSSLITLQPFSVDEEDKSFENLKSPILYVERLPLDWSFDIIYEEFSKFGPVKEIRNRLCKNHKFFETG